MSNKKSPYLPKVRTEYHPSTSDCQTSTDVGKTENIPSPAIDSIAVNNIAWQEFDYTEDPLSDESNEDVVSQESDEDIVSHESFQLNCKDSKKF